MIAEGLNRRRPRLPSVGSLRTAWLIAMVSLLTLIVLLVVAAVGMAHYQRELFNATTSDLEQRMSAVVALESALREIDGPAAGLMYQLGGPGAYEQHGSDYARVSGEVDEAFDQVTAVVGDHHGEAHALAAARESWGQMHGGVLAAPALVEEGAVAEALKAGVDPFAETWEAFTGVGESLTDLRGLLVADLQAHMAGAERVQRLIVPVGSAVLVVALGVALLTGRMLQRRVLGPILALRSAAARLQDPHGWEPTDAVDPDSVAEVAELASALQATAVSLQASHQRLRDQAHRDPLTGLANRIGFTAVMESLFAAPGAERVAALFVDLDDFKVVNDTLGHAAGDELLTIVARRLESATRDTALVARLGGDEFAVVVRDADEAVAVNVASRVLEALEAPIGLGEQRVTVGCSIGVAVGCADQADGDAAELLHQADQAMYTAKKHGKHRVEVFSADLYANLQARTELRQQLSEAVDREEFELHFQPIMDLQAGTVLGLEALIRWRHPIMGLLAPGEFIALAEETGDIVAIGAWVIDEACRQLAAWHADGTYDETIWVSVNLSAKQLDQPDLVPVVLGALARHQLQPSTLVLEITEAVAVTNTARAIAVLDQLRAQGVAIALDDFGMGFSSLGYLAELPIDVLKIDRTFVASEQPRAYAALHAIVMLGQRLGLRVIAEGIETTAHLETLRQLGPLAGQGYLFARPGPPAALTGMGGQRAIAAITAGSQPS